MIDHVTLAVSDFHRSRAFYDAALSPLGINRLYADGECAAGYGRGGKAFFWIAQQNKVATQTHVAFAAADRDAIDQFFQAGLDHGGSDNGGPGPRPQYHASYYAAFLLDPDGNNIEAVVQ